MHTPEITRATIAADFNSKIEELRGQIDPNDRSWIMSWDNGLFVGFAADGKPFASFILNAEVVGHDDMPEEAWAFVPSVKNGANEGAKVIRRQEAIAAEIERLKGLVDTFNTLAA
jgi:hypothetical protein